jgi:hypothetical protein
MNKFWSLNIKIALLVMALIIVILVLFYSQVIVNKIQDREREIAELYAKSIEYIANDESSTGEYSFIFDQIINQLHFPIIATDPDYRNITFMKNVNYDSTKVLTAKDTSMFFEMVKEMDELNEPIVVSYKDSIVLTYVHYGPSDLVTDLKLLPFYEFLIAGIFLLLGYIGFSFIKKHEQSNIWVGLSRETAHQLGTPLTSLLGWTEMLKTIEPRSRELDDIASEISNDLEKLNKIAGRFSKIGSQPKLDEENIPSVIKKVTDYFERRIPTLVTSDGKVTKKISVEINSNGAVKAKINRDLFEWVIENLLKNALDAIDKTTGKITFNLFDSNGDLCIDVTDSGKGIDTKFRKDIFRPGFSTKMRGWGLGLSLSKRIIEDYHKGKLILLESAAGKGTTFRIKLNKF